MKIIDGIKHKGRPFEIPDCSRNDLPVFFKSLGFNIGAEVGVSMGENLERYCKAGLKMYGIDAWSNEEDGMYANYSNIAKPYKTMDEVYNATVKRLSSYSDCTLIRKRSLDALKDIPNDSLDFVYIDGNHMYGYVAMDLMTWACKVKKGGIIAGHDYYRPDWQGGVIPKTTRGVKYAVDGFVKTFEIDNWYLLGRKKLQLYKGEIRDKELSYMFFKHW